MPRWPDISREERFWMYVDVRADDECWLWTGGQSGKGYGKFRMGRADEGHEYAHRFALTLKLGRSILEGMFACHTCDVPLCVNPAHLWEGTVADNNRDMVMKNRHRWAREAV